MKWLPILLILLLLVSLVALSTGAASACGGGFACGDGGGEQKGAETLDPASASLSVSPGFDLSLP